jgi:hypothetical protein
MDLSRRAWSGSKRARLSYAEQQRLWIELLEQVVKNLRTENHLFTRITSCGGLRIEEFLPRGEAVPKHGSLALELLPWLLQRGRPISPLIRSTMYPASPALRRLDANGTVP